ncbi:MAG TPA: hypothetical protein VM939_01440 [Gemmatimonadaceae bacterium]|nr:hypothetical protein [Gemmatimonadaceae bacterium]
MAAIVAIGPDMALLEGLAQTLVAAGHKTTIASDIPAASRLLLGSTVLVAVIDRREILESGSLRDLPLAHGGALVVFHSDDDGRAALPQRIQRLTMAHLQLPLERQRLLALVKHIEGRARISGRVDDDESFPAAPPP